MPTATPGGKSSGVVRVVTRGDDAGACVEANKAVERAAREGVLRNASVIACGPALPDAARRLKNVSGLCIGLHLTLNSEWDRLTWGPLTRHPLLTDERGFFPQSPTELPRTSEAIDAMLQEADAQLAALREVGLEPFYLDEHMVPSAWAVPELKAPLEEWAAKNGLHWPRLFSVPGEGDLHERLKTCPDGDYLWVNHPCLSEGDALKMGNSSYPLAEILAEREADLKLWLTLNPDERVQFVSWRDVLTLS
jgi:chitin disaccharide deacetylase